jgi:hypothetical protein
MIYYLRMTGLDRAPPGEARPSRPEFNGAAARARVAELQRGRRGTPEEIALLEAGLLIRG